jgi:hypothetical protein
MLANVGQRLLSHPLQSLRDLHRKRWHRTTALDRERRRATRIRPKIRTECPVPTSTAPHRPNASAPAVDGPEPES